MKLIMEHIHGAEVMAEWATLWASGTMPPALVAVWNPALVRPFYKVSLEGKKIRPVLCAEVLLKVPVGALVQQLQKQIETACGPRQYGAGRSGGATLQMAEERAAARLRPRMAIVGWM